MRLSDIIAQPQAIEAVRIALSSPYPCSLLISGSLGSGKSAILSAIHRLPLGRKIISLPSTLSAEDFGAHGDWEQSLKSGHLVYHKSLEERLLGSVVLVDNANMMAPEVLARLLDMQANSPHQSAICLIAAVNTSEGGLRSTLLDRFDLYVSLSRLDTPLARVQILRQSLEPACGRASSDDDTATSISEYRDYCRAIEPEECDYTLAAELCRQASVLGHRADIALLRAASVYAAMQGRRTLIAEDFEAVRDLVLGHRLTNTQHPDEQPDNGPSQEESTPPTPQEQEDESRTNTETPPERETEATASSDGPSHGAAQGVIQEQRADIAQMELQQDPVSMLARQCRQYTGFGSRLKSLMASPRGRYYKPTSHKPNAQYKVSLLATLRASIPHQKLRRRDTHSELAILIRESDIRYKLCRRRTGYHILFAVDASGSMGAKRRMSRVKGLIIELLRRAYEERDYVGLLTFRGDEASIQLPLTKSISRAHSLLQELHTGGRTPLYLGLKQSLEVLQHVARKSRGISPVLVLVTDGRATSRYPGENSPEVLRGVGADLRKLGTKIVVIDSEEGFIRMRKAQSLAELLSAEAYYTMDELVHQDERFITSSSARRR